MYDQQILQILTQVGERGISVSSLAKHVYNQNCTFFHQPDWQEVRQYVQQYLLRNSRQPQGLLERTGRRGYYRLNTRSADARQMMLEFTDNEEENDVKEEKASQEDRSLFLDF